MYLRKLFSLSFKKGAKLSVWLALGIGAIIGVWAITLSSNSVKASASDYTLDQITTLLVYGARPGWSPDGSWIAYDWHNTSGKWDVYRVHPDGTGNECVTCNRSEVPKNNGAPGYHPSGRYLVFTAEKAEHGFVPPWSTATRPGAGIYHDVTVLDFQTNQIYRLTDVRSVEPAGGSLLPKFSHDGTKIAWGDFEDRGSGEDRFENWQIAVANFVTTPEPHLENVTYYNPNLGGRSEWYEMQGWTLDDSGIYFACAPLEGQDDYASDLCRMDLATQQLTRLTLTSGLNGEPAEFEEHGELSPLGDAIIFMSSEPWGIDPTQYFLNWLRTDLWIMNPDGSSKTKLTHFNDAGYPESDPQGERVMVSEMGWSPDGTWLTPSANAADKGGDNNGFEVNPANAYSDNGSFAVDTNSGTGTSTSCTNSKKDRHLFYNYSFTVPGGATIIGIEVRLDAKVDSTAGSPKMCVQLSWDGGNTWTTAKSTTTLTTSETTYILGSATDTWGRMWSDTNFSNANFRLRVVDVASSTARDFSLDWVAVRVHY